MSHYQSLTVGLAMTAFTAISGTALSAAEEVNLVLNWLPGGDHAPIFWAKEQGWYSDAGIELNIENGTGSGASAKKVGIGRNEVGIADLPTVLRAIGKEADILAVMNIYANSPYGIYWKKSTGIDSFEDLKGHTIGNPPFDAARQMWPAIAKALNIDPASVNFVNVKPNAKIAALKSDAIDATTSFYNIHYIFEGVLGDDMGFVALRDIGFNPYGNSIIANGAWAAENGETLSSFVSVTQKAYATCVATPEPCIETLAKAGSQKVEDVTKNWNLVVELMTADSSVNTALGYFDPARMVQDYDDVQVSFDDVEPFEVTSSYSNDFLDMDTKMPAGN